jgi:hypothetical protein
MAYGEKQNAVVGNKRAPAAPTIFRHCEPTGPREAQPDDRLRSNPDCLRGKGLDCSVATLLAMTRLTIFATAAGTKTPNAAAN